MSRSPPGPSFTPKQGQYLAFIYAYTRVQGHPPAEAELQRYFGVSSPSVHQMILTLERAGSFADSPALPAASRSWSLPKICPSCAERPTCQNVEPIVPFTVMVIEYLAPPIAAATDTLPASHFEGRQSRRAAHDAGGSRAAGFRAMSNGCGGIRSRGSGGECAQPSHHCPRPQHRHPPTRDAAPQWPGGASSRKTDLRCIRQAWKTASSSHASS